MTGLIILAAGSSSRLGKPKQNLVYQRATLLQRAVNTALSSVCRPVVLVLGANAEMIAPAVENKEVAILQNQDWQEGMASSIRCGLDAINKAAPNLDSLILMLCDQPFVYAGLLNRLVKTHTENYANIIASAYSDTMGPPVLFGKKYFEELLTLTGQEGAKKLIIKYNKSVVSIPFPEGGIDIDTVEDYEKLT